MREPPATFDGALQQLRRLHDEELAHLRCENSKLQDESAGLRGENSKLQHEIQRLRESSNSSNSSKLQHELQQDPAREPVGAVSDSTDGRDARALVAVPVVQPRQPDNPEVPPRQTPRWSGLVRTASSASAVLLRHRAANGGLVGWSAWLVGKRRFDFAVGVVICANSVTIGIEASYRHDGEDVPKPVIWLEYLFIFLYTAELLLRFCASGPCKALASNWVKLDLALVLCAYISEAAWTLDATLHSFLDKVLLIRILRLARLVRVLRMVVLFRTLYVLVSGLMNSLLTLLWTGTVIFVLIYCFSILGLELVQVDVSAGEGYNDTVEQYFGGLFETMLTLLQGVTLDSLGGVYRPLILAKPYLALYFVAFILLASIALVNLVTAIMVEAALSQAGGDKEAQSMWQAEQKREQINELNKMFVAMDTDSSGRVNVHELEQAEDDVKARILALGDATTVSEVFSILDYDNSGDVGIDEFCEGMLKIQSGTKIEIFAIQKMLSCVINESRDIKTMLALASRTAEVEL